MDCSTCRSMLADHAVERLTAESRPGLREHLRVCPECRDIERLLRGGQVLPAVEAPDGLLDDVLRRTSGSACGAAADRACDLVDSRLTGIDMELMQLHLDDCRECAELVSALGYLSAKLPSMARIEPGPVFTRGVLASTFRRPAEPRRHGADVWRTVWQRPRFAVELAYVAAVTLWIAFSLTGSPLDRQAVRVVRAPAVQRLAAAPEAVPRVVARAASLGEAAWETAEQRSASTIRTVRGDLSRRVDRSRGAREALQRNGAELRHAAVNLDIKSGYSALSRVPGDLANILKQFASSPSEPPSALDRS